MKNFISIIINNIMSVRKLKRGFYGSFIAFLTVMFLWLLIAPDTAEARRGSFGGSRGFSSRGFGGGSRSFGGSKSFGGSRKSYTPRSTPRRSPSTSFGSRRSSPSNFRTSPGSLRSKTGSSFGGSRLSSSKDYTAKYGVPRKTIPAGTDSRFPSNYVVHSYGGYGSGLMTGYLMGSTSWMWAMPFHPAFYYSRPYYAQNPDGTMDVYPPTFSWSKLFFTIIIFAAIVYIIYAIIRSSRRKRVGSYSKSSFS
jgi:hypothetical protein